MTTLAVAEPLFGHLDREATLDDVVVRAWEGLVSHQAIECPVCHGEMRPEYGAQARPIGGRCRNCGAALD